MSYANEVTRRAPDTAETPVASEISRLDSYLHELGNSAEELHTRLSMSVLRPETSVQSIGANAPKEDVRPMLCPTGERISTLTSRVRRLNEQLRNALDRLEA